MRYTAKYKCRNCKDIFYEGLFDEVTAKRLIVWLKRKDVAEMSDKNISRYNQHSCFNGDIGQADFLGFEALNDLEDEYLKGNDTE